MVETDVTAVVVMVNQLWYTKRGRHKNDFLINTRNNNYGIPMVIGIATDGDAENALKGGRDWMILETPR